MEYDLQKDSGYQLSGVPQNAGLGRMVEQVRTGEALSKYGMALTREDIEQQQRDRDDQDRAVAGSALRKLRERLTAARVEVGDDMEGWQEKLKELKEDYDEEERPFFDMRYGNQLDEEVLNVVSEANNRFVVDRRASVARRVEDNFRWEVKDAEDNKDYGRAIGLVMGSGLPDRQKVSLVKRYESAQRDDESLKLAETDPEKWTDNYNNRLYDNVSASALAASKQRASSSYMDEESFGTSFFEVDAHGKAVKRASGTGEASLGRVPAGIRSLTGDTAAGFEAKGEKAGYEDLLNSAYDQVEKINIRDFPGGINGREYQVRKAADIAKMVDLGLSQTDAKGVFDYRESQNQSGSLKDWGGEAELWDFMEKENYFNSGGNIMYRPDLNGNYLKSSDSNVIRELATNKIAIRVFSADWKAEHPDANVREYFRALNGFLNSRTGKSLPMEDLLMLRKGEMSPEEESQELLSMKVDREISGVKKFEEGLLDDIYKGGTYVAKAKLNVNMAEDFDGLLIGQDIVDQLGVKGERELSYAFQLPDGGVYRPAQVKVVSGNRIALGRKAAAKLRVYADKPLSGALMLSVPAVDWRTKRDERAKKSFPFNLKF